jgi:membrane protein implicated in regulation of membrane protease activity
MGIGGGFFLLVLGAILAFAVHGNLSWLDVHLIGWVLMLAGVAVIGLTIWFSQQRRARHELTRVEQTRMIHDPDGVVAPEPPDVELPHLPPA